MTSTRRRARLQVINWPAVLGLFWMGLGFLAAMVGVIGLAGLLLFTLGTR